MHLEETLDPADWEALRALAHRMVDDLIDDHAGVAARPAWQPVPAAALTALREPPPAAGEGAERAYAAFREFVQPYPLGNIHPRGWGWVNGTGSTLGALAEMLAAGMNTNAWGAHQSSAYVEAQVLEWAKLVMGFPSAASGILVSGGSVANLIGLAAAREAGAEHVSRTGVHAHGRQLVFYGSDQTHNSVDKAAGLLGIGWDNYRKIATGEDYRIDVRALEQAIAEDRASGRAPVCIIGNAGTVNTGAIDDLDGLATLAARERMWFHVDGAFGAFAMLSPKLRERVRGIERADSLAFDLHKWLYVPIEVGCVLVRDAEMHRRPFSPPATYLASFDRGITSGPYNYSQLGLQLTRSFRALKVWMSLRAFGTDRHAQLIEQNVRQAQAFGELVEAHGQLELVAPVPLNVVCFRYRAPGMGEEELNSLNRELLVRIQESGIAAPSSTVLRGVFALRIAITNHRTRTSDLQLLLDAAVRLGAEISA
jgi:aromatic-L-amino-acid decarboxylase